MENINLKNDFIEILKKELSDNKIIYRDYKKFIEFMVMYYDEIKRIPIVGMKYNVHFSNVLNDKIKTLPIKTQECINDIVVRLKYGKSIVTYMSKDAINANTRDNQLQNWGIYHAHVDEISKNYNKLAKRSDLVLFFAIRNNDVYLIDVKKHPKGWKWFDKSLLEVIFENWIELLIIVNKQIAFKQDVPNNKVQSMSKYSLVPVKVKGNMVLPNNMGNASAGNSCRSIIWADMCNEELKYWERLIKDNYEAIVEELREKGEMLVSIHLVKNNEGRVNIGGFKCDILCNGNDGLIL
ncbi:hypothetical protein CCS79_01480 [Clostridium diolis]|uniref:hypothetical protein n=1 Tax=Clostridium diolis TaxID=223919 RepID=UPI000B3FD9BF|nr:hypothetical protein [Clostridium diolis]OVE70670.1 hypothetical protein CCS79_01480 [Clostridium diolis]